MSGVAGVLRAPVAITAALVCFTNLAALGRGAYNRSSTASELTLTSRELRFDDPGAESTVTLLRVMWVQEDPLMFGCEAAARVGFDCSMEASHRDSHVFYARQPARTVFVALEYDGPAWRRYRAAQEKTLTPLEQHLRDPRWVKRTLESSTRLVAVDVDLDPHALRERHPDRSRYLISKARMSVHVGYTPGKPERSVVAGSIHELIPPVINVPRPHSGRLRQLEDTGGPDNPALRYRATIRYGRLLDPWVVDIAAP